MHDQCWTINICHHWLDRGKSWGGEGAAIQQTTTIKIGSISVNHCQDIFLNISQQTKTGTNPHLADSLTRPSHNSIFRVRGIPKYLVWWLTAESLWFYSFMTLINYPCDWAFVTGTWRDTIQVSASTSFFTIANIHSDAQHVKTLNMCEYINCHSGLNIRRRDLLG